MFTALFNVLKVENINIKIIIKLGFLIKRQCRTLYGNTACTFLIQIWTAGYGNHNPRNTWGCNSLFLGHIYCATLSLIATLSYCSLFQTIPKITLPHRLGFRE